MEYGCIVGGAKLILVMGHTHSGLVELAMNQFCLESNVPQNPNCPHLGPILNQIRESIDSSECRDYRQATPDQRRKFIDEVSRRNVARCVQQIVQTSPAIRQLVDGQQLAVVGALFDVNSGRVEFLEESIAGSSS